MINNNNSSSNPLDYDIKYPTSDFFVLFSPIKKESDKKEEVDKEKEELKRIKEEWNKEINEKLTTVEKENLHKYASGYFRNINDYLRKMKGELSTKSFRRDINTKINEIDKAMDKIRLSNPREVFRRVNKLYFLKEDVALRNNNEINSELVKKLKNEWEPKETEPGKVEYKTFFEHSYVSTAIIKDASPKFDERNNPVLYEIYLPEGTKAIFLDESTKTTPYKEEEELLLARGYQFRIDKISTISDTTCDSIKVNVTVIKNHN